MGKYFEELEGMPRLTGEALDRAVARYLESPPKQDRPRRQAKCYDEICATDLIRRLAPVVRKTVLQDLRDRHPDLRSINDIFRAPCRLIAAEAAEHKPMDLNALMLETPPRRQRYIHDYHGVLADCWRRVPVAAYCEATTGDVVIHDWIVPERLATNPYPILAIPVPKGRSVWIESRISFNSVLARYLSQ